MGQRRHLSRVQACLQFSRLGVLLMNTHHKELSADLLAGFLLAVIVAALLLFTTGCTTMRQPLHDKPVMILAVAQASLAVTDYTTTLQLKASAKPNEVFTEHNPVMRPFVAHGAAGLVPVIATETVLDTWLSHKMRTSPHKWERKLFWVPQAIAIGSHMWGLSVTLPASK